MKDEIRENDIVEVTLTTGGTATARVRWVNEKKQAGITYIAPDVYKGSASVVSVDELEVIQRDIGEELKYASLEELKAAVKRLRGMRLPKKPATRRAYTRKKSVRSKLDALFEGGGDALDSLIKRAVQEIKDEKEGDK